MEIRLRTPSRISCDSEFVHQLIKSRAANTEFYGSRSDLAFVPPKASWTISRSTLSRASFSVRRQGADGIGQLQILGRNALAISHDGGTADSVLQLEDVSGPRVKTQGEVVNLQPPDSLEALLLKEVTMTIEIHRPEPEALILKRMKSGH
jgi:hypothetical protein